MKYRTTYLCMKNYMCDEKILTGAKMTVWQSCALSILRIMSALLFMEHGLAKLFHFPAPQPGVTDPLPPLLFIGGIIEIIGGALLTAGLFTRIVAFVCAGQMAVAYFLKHAPQAFWPALNQGDAAILLCFVFFYVSVVGGGIWSFDNFRSIKIGNLPMN